MYIFIIIILSLFLFIYLLLLKVINFTNVVFTRFSFKLFEFKIKIILRLEYIRDSLIKRIYKVFKYKLKL